MKKRTRRNPARPDNSVITAMRDLATDTRSRIDIQKYWVEITASFNGGVLRLFYAVRPLQVRTTFTVEMDLPNRTGGQNFMNFYDAKELYLRLHNLVFNYEGYPQRRMRELAEQEYPKLPGGKTR